MAKSLFYLRCGPSFRGRARRGCLYAAPLLQSPGRRRGVCVRSGGEAQVQLNLLLHVVAIEVKIVLDNCGSNCVGKPHCAPSVESHQKIDTPKLCDKRNLYIYIYIYIYDIYTYKCINAESNNLLWYRSC